MFLLIEIRIQIILYQRTKDFDSIDIILGRKFQTKSTKTETLPAKKLNRIMQSIEMLQIFFTAQPLNDEKEQESKVKPLLVALFVFTWFVQFPFCTCNVEKN